MRISSPSVNQPSYDNYFLDRRLSQLSMHRYASFVKKCELDDNHRKMYPFVRDYRTSPHKDHVIKGESKGVPTLRRANRKRFMRRIVEVKGESIFRVA